MNYRNLSKMLLGLSYCAIVRLARSRNMWTTFWIIIDKVGCGLDVKS